MAKLIAFSVIGLRWLRETAERMRQHALAIGRRVGAWSANRQSAVLSPHHHSGARPTRRHVAIFRRVRPGYVSIVLVIALLIAAGYTFPLGPGPGGVPSIWRVPNGGPKLADGTDLPVFCLPETGPAVRCGIAREHAGGRIGFVSYGNSSDLRDTLPVLATADIGLLWALADPAARASVQTSATALVTQTISSLRQVTDSDTWRHEYRERLHGLLDRATQQAWRAADTQSAFRAFLRASDPVIQDSIANQIGPAMAPYISDAFWGVVEANTTQVFSLIIGGRLDLRSIGSSLALALQDPRVQVALGQIVPRLVDLPQSELLTERFAANVADALQHDPETMALLTRVAMDPRLGTALGRARNDTAEFVHRLGQVLWGLGGSSSMNALAGLSMRTQIVGESQPLILLLDTDDAAALVRTLPGHTVLLVPETVQ